MISVKRVRWFVLLCGLTAGYGACAQAQEQSPAPAAPQVQSPPLSGDEAIKAGAALFAKSGCTFCHGPAGAGTERAPSLRDVRKRKSDDEVRHQIHDGGQMMPPFGEALTADEIAYLAQFLREKDAWKLVPAPAAAAPAPTASTK